MRNVFPGSEINNIPSISKGIYEQEDAIYKLNDQKEEDKLLKNNESIRILLEGLEEKELLTEQKNESKAQ